MFSRLIRIANVSIAAIAVLILFAAYWYAVRPLPKINGQIRAPISGPARIERDARGIPHIEASSWQDALFLQGYATAQDRLWQMDGLRRYGEGELAEIAGPAALPSDEVSRRMRLRATAEADVRKLRPEDRDVFVAYARGVNFFIDTHRGDYQIEFSLPGHAYDPRPWSIVDTAVVGLVMWRQLTDEARFELEKSILLANANQAKAMILFPPLEGQMESPGSNAWVVSGAHTADGRPMLANDMHLKYGIPPTWHLVQLKAPGLDVSGTALPGVPGVITGHNDQIAWGVTNLEYDTQDIYKEEFDARNGHYIYQGKLQQAQLDRQTIQVKGAKPVEVDTWITRHGPVLLEEGGKSYSLRWTAYDGFGFPFFDIDRATNWDQFRKAVSVFWGPAQNFLYADRAGNIGYQAMGRLPIRRDFDGGLPLDGSSGKFEWDGYIPIDQLPSVYNPPGGILASANQNPFPPGYPYRISGRFDDRYRVDQIKAMLRAGNKLDAPKMLAIQKDVYSAFDSFLASQIVAAFDRKGSRNDLIREAVALLRKWNGQMDKDHPEPLVTELMLRQAGQDLMQCAGISITAIQAYADVHPKPQLIETLLRNRPSGWVKNDDWDSWLLQNLALALENGRNRQGSPVSRWRWGQALQWTLRHPFGSQLPLVSSFFDIDPVPMSGSGTTVKQTTLLLGPSGRTVVDLGDLDKSVENITTGESGHVASSHYKDEWPEYYAGTSFPMEFNHVEVKDTLNVKPE
ncbi:MAG TPA: penicillin acylase family protein [Bryobacteraceae bacterium]|nr:penicillin acylase family protein [Bryobacteraceae bacterium]